MNDDRLAFGTSKGFFVLNPDVIDLKTDYSGEVWISSFSLFGTPEQYFFKQHDTLVLNYKQNFFQFDFSASDYGIKPGTMFEYKLKGVDPNWVQNSNGYAHYTDVRPGKYLFEVTKIDDYGITSVNYASVLVIISPPFWQTVWFRMLMALLIVGSLMAYLMIYISRLKAERLNVQLEQKLLVSQMNPDFIVNTLSAIQSFMYSNDPEQAGNYLSNFSTLVRLILDNSRSEYIPIRQEVRTLELYLTLQKLRFPDKLDYEVIVDPDLRDNDSLIPPMLAQPFIENSIEHGILHKEGPGFIVVSIEQEQDTLSITVEDDGIGVKESAIRKSNQNLSFSHTSYATAITRERIRNIASGFPRQLRNQASIIITNLHEQGGKGTRVVIKVPISKVN